MEEITLKAMAKINLGLDVIRRREDGYHEVRMIMQTVNHQPAFSAYGRAQPYCENRGASPEGIRHQRRTVRSS